jgi:hypothetical protein
MIRVLRVARRGARKARVAAAEQLHGVLYSAPEELRQPLLALKTKTLAELCAAMRPGSLTSTTAATKTTLWTLARRWQQLQAELDQLDRQLQALVTSAAPPWSPCPGSGSTPPGSCWSPPATTPAAALGGRLRAPVRRRPSQPPQVAPTATGSTAGATATLTMRCGASPWSACTATHPLGPMSSAAPNKACPNSTSCAASSATSPARLPPPHKPTGPSPRRLPKIGGINEPHQRGHDGAGSSQRT